MAVTAFYKARYGEIEFIDISTMNTEKMELTLKKIYELLLIKIPNKEAPVISERYTKANIKVEKNIFKKILSLLGFKV